MLRLDENRYDNVEKKLSRKFALTVCLCIVACIGIVSHNTNWTSDSIYYIRNRVLIESRSISRGPGDRSAIPQIQESNGHSGSIFSSFSSWFGSNSAPSNTPDLTKASQGVSSVDVQQAVSLATSPAVAHSIRVPIANVVSTSADAEPFKLSREQCKAKYGERSYLPEDRKKLPPMLYTFPGAGNTWCRLLIEYATGIYSGGVYNDKTLLESLPGEFTCNQQVSVIKIHPHTHPFEGLRTGHFQSDATKCQRGNVRNFKRAIMVLRDPFDSIWSEFQRRITQSHVGGILKSAFDWHRWQANAAAMSHTYNLMWTVEHAGIERHFPPSDYLYVNYEDLKNKATRVDTLKKIVDFLDISSSERERLECAFVLADKRDTHRVVDKALTMSKEEAYTQPLACRMWALFGPHASKHGYRMWKDMDCHNNNTADGKYEPVPRVNVGPQGEYNNKWVKPGGKMIDFGGHPPNQPGAGQPGSMGGMGGNGNGGGKKNRPGQRGNKPPKSINGGGSGGAGESVGLTQPLVQQPPQAPQQQAGGQQKMDVAALAALAKKEFLDQKRKAKKTGKNTSRGKGGGGMTIEEASRRESVIAAVGADKPAWQ